MNTQSNHFTVASLLSYFEISVADLSINAEILSQPIKALTQDSRKVTKSDLFIALKGQKFDGTAFIADAINAGAIAVLCEANNTSEHKKVEINAQSIVIYIHDLAERLAFFADDFYASPSKSHSVIAITGTNGKTTITQLITQWAYLLGVKSASIGTLGNGVYGKLDKSENTTPSAVDVASYLAKFRDEGVKLTAMEVSSHGLALGRVKALDFAVSLFTNLSRDHLDFHQTLTNYEAAKWSLFANDDKKAVQKSGMSVINFDDEVGQKWLSRLTDAVAVSALPQNLTQIKHLKAYVGVSKYHYHEHGVDITVNSSFGSGVFTSKLLGEFNISNFVMALTAMLCAGFDFDELIKSSHQLSPVIGRMELITAPGKPKIVVDYAHTPDALKKALKALKAVKSHCRGKVWVIFGCGGDRDKGKRPLMAKVAEQLADEIIITNDNPRSEDQDHIISDIVSGFDANKPYQIIKDRKKAIAHAINNANEQDMILIAGKGHETYQIIGNNTFYHCDREASQGLLGIKS